MKPVHVNPHHVKKSKELDDKNPNKNGRNDSKTIAVLVNEGRDFLPLYTDWYLCGDQEPVESALLNSGGAHENQETNHQMVCHLLP